MPADITNLFKAHCKRLAVEVAAMTSDKPVSDIFPMRPKKTAFTHKAHDIVNFVGKLEKTLLERKPDYLDFLSPYPSTLTEKDRDAMDTQAEEMVVSCNRLLHLLEMNIASRTSMDEGANENNEPDSPLQSGQFYDHRLAVVSLLRAYLKAVCNELTEQKALRLRYQVDKKKNARIVQNTSKLVRKDNFQTELYQVEHPQSPTISTSEEQMFAAENEQLFEELVGMTSEVRQVEGQVLEIGRLQTALTERILTQEEVIETIVTKAVSSSEDVRLANEEIKVAMKNRAGVRVWVLFFLIIITMSLLFIDWYND